MHSKFFKRDKNLEYIQIPFVTKFGPNARSVQINLNDFTLIGATTRSGLLTAPMRARFGINNRLKYYNEDVLSSTLSIPKHFNIFSL